MTQADIRTDIKLVLNDVRDIGAVHDYRRFANEMDEHLGLFKVTINDTEQIRGWTVGYDGFQPSDREFDANYGGSVRMHRFIIRGYLGLDDSAGTEKTAAVLAETVADALDSDATLHGVTYFYAPLAELRTFDDRLFGGALCHYAEIVQEVWEWLN